MLKTFMAVLAVGGVACGSDPMPAVAASYGDVLAMVKAGGELHVAFGVPAPSGYVAVADAPSPLTAGLWRCWRNDAGEAKAERVDVAKASTPIGVTVPAVSRPVFHYPVLPNVQSFMGRQVCTPTG